MFLSDNMFRQHKIGAKEWTHYFFYKIFGHSRDIPATKIQNPGIARLKVFPWVLRDILNFCPHPFTWKTPTPPENIRTKNFRFVLLFGAWSNQRTVRHSVQWPIWDKTQAFSVSPGVSSQPSGILQITFHLLSCYGEILSTTGLSAVSTRRGGGNEGGVAQ